MVKVLSSSLHTIDTGVSSDSRSGWDLDYTHLEIGTDKEFEMAAKRVWIDSNSRSGSSLGLDSGLDSSLDSSGSRVRLTWSSGSVFLRFRFGFMFRFTFKFRFIFWFSYWLRFDFG